ncbi:MAG TPA: hypothetical protein PK400_13570, partial [Phycisphaerales bacterium]|nr:hypothetical protein [Phycisphaerales bacterium]
MHAKRLCCGFIVLTLVAAVFAVSRAPAMPPYYEAWVQRYPDSTLPQRMQETFGSQCFVCHSPSSLGLPGTCYRETLRALLNDGHSIFDALAIAHDMDSDGDGVPNGVEILTPRADGKHIGYHPGMVGFYGTDPCGYDPDLIYSGVSETPGQKAVPGDLNGDGVIDVLDLLLLLGAWGVCPP